MSAGVIAGRGKARNLLRSPLSEEEVVEVLRRYPRQPLLPPLDSLAWRTAAQNPLVSRLVAEGVRRAHEVCDAELPELTDELYRHFHLTGNRLTFERVYFERRRRLGVTALALVLTSPDDPWRPRLADSLVRKFQAIFEESSWALPAHCNWSNDDPSGREPMQIDLFCAETANLMGEVLDIFGEIIPPGLQARVHERLMHGVFENYLKTDFHWMDVTHNWNAVCHQGVIGAALSRIDDPEFLASLLMRMSDRLPRFLDGFLPDGGCSEGPGYWGYGFGFFTILNDQLELRTGGELSLFEADPHIREIALYGPRMVLSQGHLVNFADCVPSGGQWHAVLFSLADRLGDSTCHHSAMENLGSLVKRGIDWDAERADVFHLLRTVLSCPHTAAEQAPASVGDCYLPDLQVLVSRTRDQAGNLWEFAAKGGHNGEHHNHNDCGSFLVHLNGTRSICEIGAPEYTHDFFGPGRYGFLAPRSLGHSVPVINGCEQAAGSAFATRIISVDFSDNLVEFVLDLSACYPASAGCRSLVRRFSFNKSGGELTVTDTFELEEEGTLESILICDDKALMNGQSAMIPSQAGNLIVQAGSGASLRVVERCKYQDHDGSPATIQRFQFSANEGPSRSGSISLNVRYEPG